MSGRGAAGVFLEALRLDRDPPAQIRRRGRAAVEMGVGGFVLFGGEQDQIRHLVSELRELATRPLWFAADLERGAGQQFRGAQALPPPAALAHHPDPGEAVRTAGAVTGREARSLGVDLVLAPVLDLDVEARNPIVGVRSFGEGPGVVGRLGSAWIDACQGQGVAACAKHFPGHGRTRGDSHLELPVVTADRDALEADLSPFRRVADDVATVMAAHVAYPALGCPGPASLDRSVLHGLLRDEMGFGGLVLSDAMVMAGFTDAASEVSAGGGEGPLAVRALLAGCDLLLYPDDLEGAARAVEREAARSEEVSERLEEALTRSREVRAALPGGAGPLPGMAERDAGGRGRVATDRPGEEPGAGIEGSVDPAALEELAEGCLVSRGPPPGGPETPEEGRPGAGTAGGRQPAAGGMPRVRVLVFSDDPAVDAAPRGCDPEGGAFGRAFADELWRRGVAVTSPAGGSESEDDGRRRGPGSRGADARVAPEGGWLRETGVDPGGSLVPPAGSPAGGSAESAPVGTVGTVVLLRSTPRAWKGRAGPDRSLRARVREAVRESGAYLVLFGHLRLLEELELPGLCAWWPNARMERAAARWLARRLGEG